MKPARIQTLLLGLALAVLTACGGGGGGGDAPAPSPSPSPSTAPPPPPAPPPPAPPPPPPPPAPAPGPSAALSVSVSAGTGRILSVDGAIDCGARCSAELSLGRRVALRALPASGFRFDRWESGCPDFVACEFDMAGARSVSARFVAVNPAADCSLPTAREGVAPSFAASHPKLLLNHTALRDCLRTKLRLGAPEALRLKEQVDRALAGRPDYAYQPWYAALLWQMSDDPRYRDLAVAQTESLVTAEEARIAAAQAPQVAGDSYLEVDAWVGNVARVYDWCFEALTPAQRSRWLAYAHQAVWNVWLAPASPAGGVAAQWGGREMRWSGWGRDNPANNYYFHFLNAAVLLGLASQGEHPQAPVWLDLVRHQKLAGELWPLYARELQGGGSLEGTGYGTALRTLWGVYEVWERSTGERIAHLSPHARDSMAHLLHSITPSLDRLAPTGDHARDATAALFDYHRDYLLQLAALFPQDRLSPVALDHLRRSSVPRMRHSFNDVQELLYAPPPTAAPAAELSTLYWGEGTGQLMMRSDWGLQASYANFICGAYKESHAHADQGSFVLFHQRWLADDANLRSDSGIEQGLALHNLLRLNDAQGQEIRMTPQGQPCRVMGLRNHAQFAYVAADVTPVYAFRHEGVNHYGNHQVEQLRREFFFLRPGVWVVLDRVATRTATQRVWTLNLPAAPTLEGQTARLRIGGQGLDLHALGAEPLRVTELAANRAGERGWRIEREARSASPGLYLNVLALPGALAQVEALGEGGVRLRLSDGRQASLRFAQQGWGGDLELLDAQGQPLWKAALPSTIAAPPLFMGDAAPAERARPADYLAPP
ncbi:hypothetical protein HNQ51_000926 [Inhella inkyongensis]|uniref:Bacterial repeat domain-containing protein n=1 Tax=Inhella inkyongensis TaxID=392593 RepID=A0A840S1L4_9BURK|nr:hypothetical protein [Inhella inkyongensis]MBB5203633.1 hypothetical protein [Inhella inkyongensis]